MERTIRQRMADLSVVRLDTQPFRDDAEEAQVPRRIKRRTPIDHVLPTDAVKTIVQAHGCVSPEYDAKTVGYFYTKTADIDANHSTDNNHWTEFDRN